MDHGPFSSWKELYNKSNGKLQKIIEDKAYIGCYKQKCTELYKEIEILNEQLERCVHSNNEMKTQVKYMEDSYEKKVKDLPFYSNVYSRAMKHLAYEEKCMREKQEHLKRIVRNHQQEFDTVNEECVASTPAYQQLTNVQNKLKRLELDTKILQQDNEDEGAKMKLQKEIQRDVFNSKIVNFVKVAHYMKMDQHLKREIERYLNDGCNLMAEYEQALIDAGQCIQDKCINENVLPLSKSDLPKIETTGSIGTSTPPLNLSSSSGRSNISMEMFAQREMDRKKRLQAVSSRTIFQQNPANAPSTCKLQILSQVTLNPPNSENKRKIETSRNKSKIPRLNNAKQSPIQDKANSFVNPQNIELNRFSQQFSEQTSNFHISSNQFATFHQEETARMENLPQEETDAQESQPTEEVESEYLSYNTNQRVMSTGPTDYFDGDNICDISVHSYLQLQNDESFVCSDEDAVPEGISPPASDNMEAETGTVPMFSGNDDSSNGLLFF